jgi:hypothetical protein
MRSTVPIRSDRASSMPFLSMSAFAVVPNRDAIPMSVSPERTVYVLDAVEAVGAGVAGTGLGLGLAAAVGVAVAVGLGAVVGVDGGDEVTRGEASAVAAGRVAGGSVSSAPTTLPSAAPPPASRASAIATNATMRRPMSRA